MNACPRVPCGGSVRHPPHGHCAGLSVPLRVFAPQAHPHYAPSPFHEPKGHYAAPIGYTALFYMCCVLLSFLLKIYIYIYIYIYKEGTATPNISGRQSTRLQRGQCHTSTESQALHQQRGDTRPTPLILGNGRQSTRLQRGQCHISAESQAPHECSRMVASRQDCSEDKATSLQSRKLKNGCQSTRLQRGHGHISAVSQAPNLYTGILDPRSVTSHVGGILDPRPISDTGILDPRGVQ